MIIKALVFDLDGTTADTIPLTVHSLKEVTRELTGKVLTNEDIIKEFGPIDTEVIKKLVDNEFREQSVEMYVNHFKNHFNEFIKPIEGMTQLLEFAKAKGIKLALFTGRSLRVAEIVLEKLNIKGYFDVILAGDHTVNPKPDPEGILLALDKLKVKPEESAYIGDFDVDIKASKAAGAMSILALWSSTGSDKLIKLNPDKYFRSTYEFIDWLKEIE